MVDDARYGAVVRKMYYYAAARLAGRK